MIYWESLASRLSDGATGTATVGDSSFGPPHPAAASSACLSCETLPRPFRYLSFRHSLGLVESPFSLVDRCAITIPKWFCEIFLAVSFDANRNDLLHPLIKLADAFELILAHGWIRAEIFEDGANEDINSNLTIKSTKTRSRRPRLIPRS